MAVIFVVNTAIWNNGYFTGSRVFGSVNIAKMTLVCIFTKLFIKKILKNMCLGTFTKERKLHRKIKKIFQTQQQIKIYHPANSWCASFSIIPENGKKK